jgi:citrate/tricarballylate utilization protein
MAKVRVQTYADFAWPAPLGALYRANGLAVSLVLALSLSLFLVWTLQSSTGWVHAPLQGNFYAVFPHHTLAWMFGGVFAFAMLALGVGVVRFWRQIRPGPALPGAKAEAITHALTLKYLDGGHGEGCNDEDDAFTLRRRRFHHLTFYGFILCFASTSVATLYHYVFGWSAPYALNSLPVVLGTLGGVGLLVGPLGLWRLNVKRAPGHGDPTQRPMDLGFIALLALTSLSGLALLILRDSAVMALLLAVHLGIVMALFATLPYGKFAHGVYRSASLLKAAIERRMPNTLNLGSD